MPFCPPSAPPNLRQYELSSELQRDRELGRSREWENIGEEGMGDGEWGREKDIFPNPAISQKNQKDTLNSVIEDFLQSFPPDRVLKPQTKPHL